jgi:exodeoxyribonuclease V gamma subunit
MPAFRVLTHYDLNALADKFAGDIKIRPKEMDLLSPEYVIVQTPGMKRWLALECARRNSIFTQASVLMPKQFIMKLGYWLMGTQEKRSEFERDVLPWALYRLITAGIQEGVAGLDSLKTYAGEQDRDMRLFALAEKASDILDQYMLYRPDWIESWDSGKRLFPDQDAEIWQKHLWNRLIAESGSNAILSPPRFLKRLSRRLDQATPDDALRLPRRVSLFGMSILPPQYLDIFARLGKLIDVTAYLQVPSIHYYGDFRSDRQIQWELRNRKALTPADLQSAGAGNRLLRNLGLMGKEFMELILDSGASPDELFDFDAIVQENAQPPTLLKRMQHDVLLCNDSALTPIMCSEDRWSIRMAACYGPLREVEVLHDLLLDCFADDPTLAPSDVLVVTPDVARYGPLVQMVFGDAQRRCNVSIPFAIADQSVLAEDTIARFAQDIFAAVTGRFEASAILSLFESAAALSGNPTSMDEREQLKAWCQKSGIRWGYDGEFRKNLLLPETEESSWRYGIDRMIAGYVMDDEEKLSGGLYPAVEVAGDGAELLGRLADFVDSLAVLSRQSKESRTVDEWNGILAPLIRRLLAEGENSEADESEAASSFTGALASLRERSEVSGTGSQKFPFKIFMKSIIDELSQSGGSRGFLSGSVTVAGMLPMRSIPFRVVAMVGMNRGAFPRHTVRPLFDLMSQSSPKMGDRDSLKSDRYVFLETLLSAQERLILTWSGFDSGDGRVIPPSVLVDEFRNHLNREYHLAAADGTGIPTGEASLVDYPLHPFSSRYRSSESQNTLLRTWNQSWFRAGEGRAKRKPVFQWAMPTLTDEDNDTIDGNTIINALSDPLRTFLVDGCRIQLPTGEDAVADDELFEAGNMEQWALRDAFLKEGLGIDPDAVGRLIAGGEVPPGTPGKLAVEVQRRKVEDRFLKSLGDGKESPAFSKQPLRSKVDGRTFQVDIDNVSLKKGAALILDAGRINAKRRLKSWVSHLFLNLDGERSTTVKGLNDQFLLPPLSRKAAIANIESLHALAREGRTRLLPLILEVSWAFAEQRDSIEKARESAWKQLKDMIVQNDFAADRFHPQWAEAFGNAADWNTAMSRIPGGESDFIRVTEEVFIPFVGCLEGKP